MCGIFATINDPTHHSAQTILEGLKTLEYRGYDSWGISVVDDEGQLKIEKHTGKIGQASTILPNSTIGIGHTRWATHGGVTQKNAHPHLDCSEQLALIHNGIVENYTLLKASLIQKGHHFHSDTDTEVIVHLIEEIHQTTSFQQAVIQAFNILEGANAILVLDSVSQTIIAAKNSSPLLVGRTGNSTYFSSDATAFIPHTDQIYALEDGDVIVVKHNQLEKISLHTGQSESVTFEKMDLSSRQIDKGDFPHFLIKEIHEQPLILEKLLHVEETLFSPILEQLHAASEIILIGCGSAYHCSLLGAYFLNTAGILASAYQAHEFDQFARHLKTNSVVIAVSQSGETIDTTLACQTAKKAGATLIGLINARGSSLERLVDHVLPVEAGPEIAVVSTKAFIAQAAMLFILSQKLQGKILADLSLVLNTSAAAIHDVISDQKVRDQIRSIAQDLIPTAHLFVIGKGVNYPSALESALKIKETTYLHAEGFAAGELKHGVLSLIEPGTPAIVLTSNDEILKDTLSNAIEIKARGGKIISFSPVQFEQSDIHIMVPDIGVLNSLLNIILCQLLAYELAVLKELDPDKPRNLAKSVTVK